MIPTRGWIQHMMMRIQNAFLDTATLTLTPADAARQFGCDPAASEALLGALADAGVLVKRADGAYARLLPASRLPFAATRHMNHAA